MTASRTCRRCGASLHGDVAWCLRCHEPVRHLTPREKPLPPLAARDLIDPRSVRPEYAPIPNLRRPMSRIVGSPTSLRLLGRLFVTGVVILFLPLAGWVGPVGFVFLIGYVPIAVVVLRSTWAPVPIEPGRNFVFPPDRTRAAARFGIAALGLCMAAVGLASGGSWLAVAPGVTLFAAAVINPAWRAIVLGIAEMLERPIGLVVASNLLNVLDIVASDAAIHAGQANELNPFVGRTGSGVKVVLVLGCSLLLYRVRPRALLWPVLAFVMLSAYHMTGWLVML